MSDQQNMFEILKSDEEVSVESDEIGSSTADFIVDDEVPVRIVSGTRGEDVLTTVDRGVPPPPVGPECAFRNMVALSH